jgi:hypothetical protein
MSFKSSLFEAIEATINNYIEKIANDYSLDVTELQNLWNKTSTEASLKSTQKIIPVFKKPETATEVSCEGPSNLSKMTKNELVDLCKAKGYKVTGTKSDLIERLTSSSSTTSKEIVVVEKSREKIVHKEPEVIKQLSANIPTVPIRKNVFENYEHAETSFLFDEKTKKVIGKQNEDGTIATLSRSDIDMCNKYKFQYEIPSNLNEIKANVTVSATGDDEEEDDGSQINDDDFLEEEDEELSDEDYASDE